MTKLNKNGILFKYLRKYFINDSISSVYKIYKNIKFEDINLLRKTIRIFNRGNYLYLKINNQILFNYIYKIYRKAMIDKIPLINNGYKTFLDEKKSISRYENNIYRKKIV